MVGRPGRRSSATVLVSLAVTALKNPEVQQRLAAVPGHVAAVLDARRRARSGVIDTTLAGERGSGAPSTSAAGRARGATGAAGGRRRRRRLVPPGNPLGHRSLEARTARLRELVADLRADPALAGAAGEAFAASDDALAAIERRLRVAEAMPLGKRTRLHVQVAGQLDDLEKAIVDLA